MTRDVEVRAIIDWLIGDAPRLETTAMVEGLAHRLVAAGLPLDRFSISFALLNPTVLAAGMIWRRDRPLEFSQYAYANRDEGLYERSPFKMVDDTGQWLVLDIANTSDERFGVVADLRKEGIRHYVVVPMFDSKGRRMYVTLATKRETPFSAEQAAVLSALLPSISLVVEVKTLRSTFHNILAAYVGNEPAVEIIDGTVHRGQVTRVRAAMLLADLRGFTHLSTRMPPEGTAEVINRYYDVVVPAVNAHGGEVLKYIGDAVLAIFPAEDTGDEQAALQAMDAARMALDTPLSPFTIAGHPVTIRFGVGVHLGDAVYGNVGSGERLDFTVVGRDVNIAARIATLCSRLGRPYLVSDAVAAVGQLHGRQMGFAGAHQVRGLDQPLRVFVPDVSEVSPPDDDGVSQGLALAPD